MDKDQSKKNIPLKQAIKNAALKPFQRGKPKTQGKQSCKNKNYYFDIHVSCRYSWRLRTMPSS